MNLELIRFKITSYLLAGKMLHLITLFEILVMLILYPVIRDIETHTVLSLIIKYYFFVFLGSLPVFSQLDARSRYQNYKQIRDQICIYGYDLRLLKPVQKSRCQRDAALLAADHTGHADHCKSYFREKGYRWYHLLPDFVFSTPHFVFTLYFWKTTFFTPTYNPKFEFYPDRLSMRNSDKVILISNGS